MVIEQPSNPQPTGVPDVIDSPPPDIKPVPPPDIPPVPPPDVFPELMAAAIEHRDLRGLIERLTAARAQ